MALEKKSVRLPASLIFVAVLTLFARAWCCFDLTVRDAAFQEPRGRHVLAVMADAGDPRGSEIYSRLSRWLESEGRDLNLELQRVEADNPGTRWEQFGIPSAPPSLPVVVLTGKAPRSMDQADFVVQHWEPAPEESDLKALRYSPAREEIRKEVGRRLAVIVLVTGNDSRESRAENIVTEVVKNWSDKEPLGLAVVRVDRGDQRESLLLSFMGVGKTGPDCVGVVFGQGKLFPPLRGDEITGERLDGLLTTLVGDCSCLQPPSTLGLDIPLEWNEKLDQTVVALRSREYLLGSMSGSWGILGATFWTLGTLVFLVGLATFWIMRNQNRQL